VGGRLSLVAQIAPVCAWVSKQAQHVLINYDKISDYTQLITRKYPLITQMGGGEHYISDDREKTAAYILALDSINFGSGYFTLARERGIELEYAVIAGGLKKSFEYGALSTPAQWMNITAKDFSTMFSVPLRAHAELDGLLHNFANHLRETGEIITAQYGGKVLNLIEASGGSALKLADMVAVWEGFHDVHAYKGRDIPILKRAQIVAADLNLAIGGLRDIDKLTIFADNMVPHVLRCDGILSYTSDEPVVSGSEKEIEIRACAIHAVELMKQYTDGGFTSVNLDHMLWHRGYEPQIYNRKPHRTLGVWY
jgi:hypothetical protein